MGLLKVVNVIYSRRQYLKTAILCILLMLIFGNYLSICQPKKHSQYKNPIAKLDAELSAKIKVFDGLTDQEKIETMYDMSNALIKATDDKYMTLRDLTSHLAVLRTRKFSRTVRPDSCNGCMEYNFENNINPVQVCQGEKDIMMIMMITTVPDEIDERAAVRKTWASLTAKNTAGVRHLFLFGGGYNKIQQTIINGESQIYGDILQENFIDNYYNLSYKAIMGFRWVTNNCPKVKFIMRTACDNFIHVPKVLQMLQKETLAGHHVDFAQIGSKIKNLVVLRKPIRKWYITDNELNSTLQRYPSYCMGTAFVFHREAAKKFLRASADVPFFVIEDAYFGMVLDKIKMPVADVPGFYVEASQIGLPGRKGCPKGNAWFTVHQTTPAMVEQLWRWCEREWTLPGHLKT